MLCYYAVLQKYLHEHNYTHVVIIYTQQKLGVVLTLVWSSLFHKMM